MSIIRAYFIFIVLLCSLKVKAQTTSNHSDFTNFVGRGFKLPGNLTFNCEWMYAVVKVDINNEHIITKYKIVSHLPDTMKYNFDYIIGYKFRQKNDIKTRSLAFFFLIDNSEMCKPIEGQKIFYNPNEVVGIVSDIFQRLKLEDAKTVIDPYLIIEKYYAPQR